MIQRALDLTLVAVLLSSCLLFSGCLKTKITTGAPASAQTVQLEWAHGFVYGLVPPVNGPLAVDDECATGITEVYFRQTFVQIVAQGLTGSLYSPQTFTVTCASGEGMSDASSPTPPAYLRR